MITKRNEGFRLGGPERAEDFRVFTTEVTPESFLGIGGSNHGLSSRTVKSNHLTTFCPKNTVLGHLAAFSVLEVLVAVAFTALVLGTALSALSAAGLYLSRTHERLLLWDEEYPSLLSEVQKLIENPENLEENGEKFRFREEILYVVSEEGEEKIPVLKVELKAHPFWFFVYLPEE